ncbi:MAG: tetratricopeptide repeat protein [Syntrophobacteraceae bacterium]|jgi:tetratricopeptide (TPR) repeat protein
MLRNRQTLSICLFLAAITILAFLQIDRCDFINFDDPSYVSENVHIQNGVTVEAIRWAFTTTYQANWHPLTWMSHMLDVQLFGLNPRRHHLTNLFFHIANTILLFLIFCRMTKAPWKSAFVAALFAIHPLHVESVTWVAERKDVLSTFFWMLTMGAYIHYVEHPRLKNYLAVPALLVLGLMAKPMLVTLPFVLLLLDFWPLQRFDISGRQIPTEGNKPLPGNRRKKKAGSRDGLKGAAQVQKPQDHQYRWALMRPLVVEKIPLFVLAALSCTATYAAQTKGGAVKSFQAFPLGARIANAFVSYIVYIGKTVWPSDLAPYYPHPGFLPLWQVMGAVLLLGAATAGVIWRAKRFPYLATGWLWFAGTLVPVTGIVQVGTQAMADRYAYIPLIGLFVMAAWGIPELLRKWRYRKEVLFASSALVLSSLFAVTWTQVGYWQNSIALYDHALKISTINDVIRYNLGLAYAKLGNLRQAIDNYDRAIEINPEYVDAFVSRGIVYDELHSFVRAIEDFDSAVKIDPKCAYAYNDRGAAYAKLGNRWQAIEDYGRAINANPEYAEAHYNRGILYQVLGNLGQAIQDYDRAIEINPEYAEAYGNRGAALYTLGNHRQAISDYDKAIEFKPKHAEAYYNRGVAYAGIGDHRQAIADYDKAIEFNPEYAAAYNNRGVAYAKLGNPLRAVEDLKTAAGFGNEDARNSLRSMGVNW